MRKYIVTTDKGTFKLSSHEPMDLVGAQKWLKGARVTHIRELNFFEKVLDKVFKR